MELNQDHRLRVAVIGCGAVVERIHLPVLKSIETVTVSVLVDSDQHRLDVATGISPEARTQRSIEGIEQFADVALVALPHHLHSSIGRSLLERGMHILVEKPLATNLQDARMLVEIAHNANLVLAVGQVRRFYETFRFVRAILEQDWLGDIRRFHVQEGSEYGWPVASMSLFQKAAGGGVLFDTGAHTLDTLVAWLGPVERVEYADDCRGGVEANCTLDIQLASGARGKVELSRTRDLRNTFLIEGARGRLEVGVGPRGPVSLTVDGVSLSGLPVEGTAPSGDFFEIARRQFRSFIRAVHGDLSDTVTGRSVLDSIEVFDKCRKEPANLGYDWEEFQSDLSGGQFNGSRILVLGATGFIGSRLVEVLKQKTTASVRVLVRNLARLSNLARFDVEIFQGDVADSDALTNALAGCDYVFNCTYGKGDKAEQYRINVTAVAQLVQAAARAGVRRVVHVSTVSVYGNVAEGAFDENHGGRAGRRDVYGHTKMLGETIAIEEGKRTGVEVVVVQPTVVYGPNAPVWTKSQLRLMTKSRIGLIDEGNGLCNAVYVDDVVSALLASAIAHGVDGEKLLVSGPETVRWVEFFRAYEDMMGSPSVEPLDEVALRRARKLARREAGTLSRLQRLLRAEYGGNPELIELPPVAALRSVVRAVVPRTLIERVKGSVIRQGIAVPAVSRAPGKSLHLPGRDQEQFFRAKSTVRIDKAKELIGFRPMFTLEQGMKRTASWAKWANLVH